MKSKKYIILYCASIGLLVQTQYITALLAPRFAGGKGEGTRGAEGVRGKNINYGASL